MPTLAARRLGCPTDLELEALWLREPDAVARHGPHVDACGDCARRLDWMRSAEARFQDEVYPATVAAVIAAAHPARRAHRPWLPWLAALPAAAALALLFLPRPARPPEGYVGLKGDPVALEVFAAEAGGARRLSDGDRIPAAAGLRFVARAPGRTVLLLSVDAAGTVSRIQPPAGAEPHAADGLLPGGALLDGVPGPERIFAVFPSGAAGLDEAERAAREAFAGGGPERVRALRRLPVALDQATLLVEKVGPAR
jgi:hypothetical protein